MDPIQQTSWQPSTAGLAALGMAGVVMAITSVTGITDAPGRFLAGVAAVGLLVFASMSWRARPKLAITEDGLVVRGWWRTRTLRRQDVQRIRITEFRRIGRKARLLEIPLDEFHFQLQGRASLANLLAQCRTQFLPERSIPAVKVAEEVAARVPPRRARPTVRLPPRSVSGRSVWEWPGRCAPSPCCHSRTPAYFTPVSESGASSSIHETNCRALSVGCPSYEAVTMTTAPSLGRCLLRNPGDRSTPRSPVSSHRWRSVARKPRTSHHWSRTAPGEVCAQQATCAAGSADGSVLARPAAGDDDIAAFCLDVQIVGLDRQRLLDLELVIPIG